MDISGAVLTLDASVVNTGGACVRFGGDNIHILSIYRNVLCSKHNAVRESNETKPPDRLC